MNLPVEPCDPSDRFIKNYTKDQYQFCECFEFEQKDGGRYRICVDQDGGEWIEEL